MKREKKVRLVVVLLISAFLVALGTGVLWAGDKPITLKFSVIESTKAARYIHGHEPWAKAVEKATQGKVKVNIFPSSALASGKQVYDATINGIIDIGYTAIPYYPGRFPMTQAFQTVGLNISTPTQGSKILMELYNKYPQIQAEFKEVKLLFLYQFAPISIAVLKNPINKLEDVKGLRLRVAHKQTSALLKLAGASAMYIKPPDIFLSLQKGIVDGSVMGWSGHQAFGTTKIANYFTVVPSFPGPIFAIFMNKGKWDGLPSSIQEGILSVSGDSGSRHYAQSAIKESEVGTKDIRANQEKKIITLSEEEMEKWAKLAAPLQEKTINKLESKGLPGKEYFKIIKDLVKKYKGM